MFFDPCFSIEINLYSSYKLIGIYEEAKLEPSENLRISKF